MGVYKGVFWMTDNRQEGYIFRIPCDCEGNVVGQAEYQLNSKNGQNYNHKLLWASLPKLLTQGKPFDYFPRGRVEIRNSHATVYLNPDINIESIQEYLISQFGLSIENGIMSVRFVSDGSNHYKYKR